MTDSLVEDKADCQLLVEDKADYYQLLRVGTADLLKKDTADNLLGADTAD